MDPLSTQPTLRTLVGRDLETRQLVELIDRASQRGGALVITGEAGVGKSALLAAVADYARATGARVLSTAGVESEQHLLYAGVQRLVHPARLAIDDLPGPQRDALRAAVGMTDREVTDAYMVGLAVLSLLADVAARGPVLVLVEDAHWLDRASGDALAFVARRLESEPIVLLAATRDGERSPLDDAALPSLAVQRLADGAAAELLQTRAPGLAPGLRRRILSEAAGNPLALIELPASTGTASETAPLPLSARLEHAFSARVSELPSATRAVLLVAALNDSHAVAETLDACALMTGAPATDADVDAAVQARLIQVDGTELTFRHPLVRSAIAQSAGLVERHAAHAALSEVLREAPDRRAWHRAAATARPDEHVAVELETAAWRAQRRGGVLTAVAALERSARLSTDPRQRAKRLLRAADLAVESGQRELVLRLLADEALVDLTPRERALALWVRSNFDDGIREEATGVRALAALARDVAADGDVDLAMRILWSAALRCFWSQAPEATRDEVAATAEALPLDPMDARVLAVLAYTVPLRQGRSIIDRLERLAADHTNDAFADRFLGTAAVVVGDFTLAARFTGDATPGLRAQGRLGPLARALSAQAYGLVRLGDLHTAIPTIEEAARLDRETSQPIMYATVRAAEAELAALRGDFDRAWALAAEAEQISLPVGARPVLATVQCARGVAALGEGRYEDAYTHLRRMHDPADPAFHGSLRCYAIADLGDAAARAGRAAEVAEIMAGFEAFAELTPSPALHLGLRHAQAVLADDRDAEQRFERALRLDVRGSRLARARTQLAYGQWLRRHRRAVESRDQLRAARTTFDALGVLPWSERARDELRAAGEASPRRTPDARDQLTAQELHIAQLAAEGLTNREIGQRLYLSHRTISSHLYRIFPKLGVTSRAGLGAVIHAGARAEQPRGSEA